MSTTHSAFRASLSIFLSLCAIVWLAACASTVDTAEGETKSETLADAPFVGTWTSELDGATAIIEPTGIFSIDVPARGEKPARSAVGRWTFNGEIVVFTNLSNTASCADVPGSYKAEVVRDVARFELVRDECAPRQEHMAWPWKRANVH
ncbi:MAG: hypothetical protein QM516_01545 [Limnohabitans sp.]|nr:hypothetical protein [Limnohabitans sp.]